MFFAIGTALCTGLAAVLTAEIAWRVSGALIISCWRALTAAILLILFVWWGRHWPGMETRHLPAVIGSSLSAAVLGEFCLNKAYRELGARRAALMFATAAPFSVLVGWLFLGESPTLSALLGIALVVVGLALAIWFTPLHEGNNDRHNEATASFVGVLVGLVAGLAQAIGNAMARSALTSGADPVAVMALRAVVATLALWSVWLTVTRAGKVQRLAPSAGVLAVIGLGAFFSFALGNTLLMIALRSGEIAIVTTLAATTPVMLLPLTWWRSGRCPDVRAWLGAVLTVGGVACIAFLHTG